MPTSRFALIFALVLVAAAATVGLGALFASMIDAPAAGAAMALPPLLILLVLVRALLLRRDLRRPRDTDA